MDLGAGLADFAASALCLQAGAMMALAVALAAAVAHARRQGEARAARIAAENEGLRDELWRLKEAASERDRAEAASEAKSRFLTTMSHEIRTPISGILGMADLLREASLSGRGLASTFSLAGLVSAGNSDIQGGPFRSRCREGRSSSTHGGRSRTARAARPE